MSPFAGRVVPRLRGRGSARPPSADRKVKPGELANGRAPPRTREHPWGLADIGKAEATSCTGIFFLRAALVVRAAHPISESRGRKLSDDFHFSASRVSLATTMGRRGAGFLADITPYLDS